MTDWADLQAAQFIWDNEVLLDPLLVTRAGEVLVPKIAELLRENRRKVLEEAAHSFDPVLSTSGIGARTHILSLRTKETQ